MTTDKLPEGGILAAVADYYGSKVRMHGATAQGVDWNSAESQRIRFEQLARVMASAEPATFNDIGCGYGALFDYLIEHNERIRYCGIDVSADMIAAALALHPHDPRFAAACAARCPAAADYTVASGIFNVRLGTPDEAWLDYVHSTLDHMAAVSSRGFAFNCLTSYSDPDRMRPDLYYADPCALFDRCKRLYSRNVALLHDYGLFEFTILVRKVP